MHPCEKRKRKKDPTDLFANASKKKNFVQETLNFTGLLCCCVQAQERSRQYEEKMNVNDNIDFV